MTQADCVHSTPPTHTSAVTPSQSRRGFLAAAAVAAGGTALALAAIPPAQAAASPVTAPSRAEANPALSLWHERQRHVEALRPLVVAYNEASEQLPEWARPGHRMIDHEGKPCGELTGWPLDLTITPPAHEGNYRVVRPSIHDAKRDFDFFMRTSGSPGSPGYEALRAKVRQNMRQRIRTIVARLRERHRIYEELRLYALGDEIQTECELIFDAELALEGLDDPSPDKFAARLMAQLTQDCNRDAVASGNGYCATAAMAATALEALLPSLSDGLIREHAAFFVANRTAPFSAMPFRAA